MKLSKTQMDKAIRAGLKSCNIIQIANEDIVTGASLERFLEGAVASIKSKQEEIK